MSDRAADSRAVIPGGIVTISAYGGERFLVAGTKQGGMGLVLELVPVERRPPVVLKTYQAVADPQQFEKEAAVWTMLSGHPNIARAIWYGEWEGQACVLCDWYPSVLTPTIVSGMRARDTVALVDGIVAALSFAIDDHGVLHRDIKPSNVLLDAGGVPRLADFGLATVAARTDNTLIGGPHRAHETRTFGSGSISGTPRYMAPELFTGRPASIRTEMFALGVTLYELLTGGEHPYAGEETGGAWVSSLRQSPLERLAGAHRFLVSVIERMVALDPEQRPSSYDAVRDMLGSAASLPHQGDADAYILQAAVLRKQGSPSDAVALLVRALDEMPSDPALMNALAMAEAAGGHDDRSVLALRAAVAALSESAGHRNGKVYPDPIINLARHEMLHGDKARAAALLREAQAWSREEPDLLARYAEFGWLDLYDGDFETACRRLAATLERWPAHDPLPLHWFVLAAFLSGEPEEWALRISAMLRPYLVSSGNAMLALPLAAVLSPRAANDLLRAVPLATKRELENDLQQAQVPAALEEATTFSHIELVLRSLDAEVTGGRYASQVQSAAAAAAQLAARGPAEDLGGTREKNVDPRDQAVLAVMEQAMKDLPSIETTGDGSELDAQAVTMIQKYIAATHVWENAPLSKGFDCSGLVQMTWNALGVEIPRTTAEQWAAGMSVPLGDLKPGDALFFGPADSQQRPTNVGLYVGENKFIEAPGSGAIVKISTLDGHADYLGARRFL